MNPAWVEACAAVVAAIGVPVVGLLVKGAFAGRDEKVRVLEVAMAENVAAAKAANKMLFDKYDALNKELQAYKLHVAETYVNQAALEKLLLPIERRLETIEQDLRKERNQ